jgi:hypothetical protein
MRGMRGERRSAPRIRLQIPMFIRGVDASGVEFIELARTLDISSTGVFLASPRRLRVNELAKLTIPAPPPTSPGALPPETPPIQGRVRRLRTAGDIHLMAVEFLSPLE